MCVKCVVVKMIHDEAVPPAGQPRLWKRKHHKHPICEEYTDNPCSLCQATFLISHTRTCVS